jgi:hypothetical protein
MNRRQKPKLMQTATEVILTPEQQRAQVDAANTRRQAQIIEDKELRLEIEKLKILVRTSPYKSAERTLAYRALQQAKHWLGEDLQELGTPYPYPNSMDTSNTIVDPTADVPK